MTLCLETSTEFESAPAIARYWWSQLLGSAMANEVSISRVPRSKHKYKVGKPEMANKLEAHARRLSLAAGYRNHVPIYRPVDLKEVK
jgi:hypothetical protein